MHTLEPLLAGCVPKVCNRDTALTACGAGGQKPGHPEHLCVQKHKAHTGDEAATQWPLLRSGRRPPGRHAGAACTSVHGVGDGVVRVLTGSPKRGKGGDLSPNPQKSGPVTAKTRPISRVCSMQTESGRAEQSPAGGL